MRINVAVPEAHVEAPVLNAALEATTRLNEAMLKKREVPTFDDALSHRKGGIRWAPEPPGAEHFDHAKTVMVRGWGDCDDLAPWHAASLRHTGEDPNARAVVKRSGPKRWHAIVQRGDGSFDDPSKEAGMGKHRSHGVSGMAGVVGIAGAVLPLMPGMGSVLGGDEEEVGAYIVRPQIAMRPVRGAFQARADLPWMWREHLDDKPTPVQAAMTTLHTAPVASTALTGCLDGIVDLADAAGFADPDHVDRLEAIAACCDGASWDELVDGFGEEHAEAAVQSVVGFFGGLGKVLKSVTKPLSAVVKNPLVKAGLSFVPGGNLASTALDVANQVIPGGGGARRPAAAPGGPRVIRPAAPAFGGAAPSGGGGFNLRMRCVPFG